MTGVVETAWKGKKTVLVGGIGIGILLPDGGFHFGPGNRPATQVIHQDISLSIAGQVPPSQDWRLRPLGSCKRITRRSAGIGTCWCVMGQMRQVFVHPGLGANLYGFHTRGRSTGRSMSHLWWYSCFQRFIHSYYFELKIFYSSFLFSFCTYPSGAME